MKLQTSYACHVDHPGDELAFALVAPRATSELGLQLAQLTKLDIGLGGERTESSCCCSDVFVLPAPFNVFGSRRSNAWQMSHSKADPTDSVRAA